MHFTDKLYYFIPHYPPDHTDNNARDAIAIIISNKITYHKMSKYDSNLQATTVKIKTHTYDLSMTAVYCPPKHNIIKISFTFLTL